MRVLIKLPVRGAVIDGARRDYEPGQVRSLPDSVAARMIAAGLGEPAPGPRPPRQRAAKAAEPAPAPAEAG